MGNSEKYDKLCEMLPQVAQDALETLRHHFTCYIVVPHHDYRTAFSKLVQDAFIQAGFSIDRASSGKVIGEECTVFIQAISADGYRGIVTDAAVLPTSEGLSPRQIKIMASLRPSLVGKMYDY